MKTDVARKVIIKIGGQETHETSKNTRRTLCVLQQTATDKENLVGRSRLEKISKLSSETIKHKTFSEIGIQTDAVVSATDLASEYPGVDYWRKLSEKQAEDLDHSFREIEALKEENKIYKSMYEEAATLVEILKEELLDKDGDEEGGEENEKDD